MHRKWMHIKTSTELRWSSTNYNKWLILFIGLNMAWAKRQAGTCFWSYNYFINLFFLNIILFYFSAFLPFCLMKGVSVGRASVFNKAHDHACLVHVVILSERKILPKERNRRVTYIIPERTMCMDSRTRPAPNHSLDPSHLLQCQGEHRRTGSLFIDDVISTFLVISSTTGTVQ